MACLRGSKFISNGLKQWLLSKNAQLEFNLELILLATSKIRQRGCLIMSYFIA
jgi:hypothetical protein